MSLRKSHRLPVVTACSDFTLPNIRPSPYDPPSYSRLRDEPQRPVVQNTCAGKMWGSLVDSTKDVEVLRELLQSW